MMTDERGWEGECGRAEQRRRVEAEEGGRGLVTRSPTDLPVFILRAIGATDIL